MPDNLFDVKGKIVVITGGLGQLGRQFTTALTARGAKVAVFDTAVDSPHTPFKNDLDDPLCIYEPVDVTRRTSIQKGLQRVIRQWGLPDALINNAAIDSPPDSPAEENGPFENYPEESYDRIMEINTKGVVLACQVIGGAMAEKGQGSIINICSIYGLVSPDQKIYAYRQKSGTPFFKPVAYSVSKSALLNLTRYLATYWGGRNIRVNTLTFGGVYNNQDKAFLANYCDRVPLGRMANENEYNGAIIFLLSDASSYMTGANLIIDGGWTAW